LTAIFLFKFSIFYLFFQSNQNIFNQNIELEWHDDRQCNVRLNLVILLLFSHRWSKNSSLSSS